MILVPIVIVCLLISAYIIPYFFDVGWGCYNICEFCKLQKKNKCQECLGVEHWRSSHLWSFSCFVRSFWNWATVAATAWRATFSIIVWSAAGVNYMSSFHRIIRVMVTQVDFNVVILLGHPLLQYNWVCMVRNGGFDRTRSGERCGFLLCLLPV